MDPGFLNKWWSDAWTVIGTIASILGAVLTVAGLAWTLVQVYKIKSAAEAARIAAEDARQQSRLAFQRYASSNCHHYVSEVKDLFAAQKWDLAVQRLADLVHHSIQLVGASESEHDRQRWAEVAEALRVWENIARQLSAAERGDLKRPPRYQLKKWHETMSMAETRFLANLGPFADGGAANQ